MVWGANFAVRRSAVERIGEFDESFDRGHGDEEEWLERLRAAGGRIVYLADAGLDHRRPPGDSGLGSLARAAYHRGRGARVERPAPRPRAGDRARAARTWPAAAGTPCAGPVPQGVIMGAHAAGRLVEALRPR